VTQAISGNYQDFAEIYMVYRRFSAMAELYTLMAFASASERMPFGGMKQRRS
jgi:hypothetical protein